MTLPQQPYECIFLELTNRCNFNCHFCPNGSMSRPRGRMDEGLARRLLDEIARENLCRWVNLSLMGEPLLHPSLVPIARHGAGLGLPLHVITNMSLLNPERIRALLGLPIAHLALSLQTPDPVSFALKKAPGRFSLEQSLETVERTVRAKLDTGSPTEITIHLLTTRIERPRGMALLEGTRERIALAGRFRERARAWARELSLPPPPSPGLSEPLRFWLGLDGHVPLLPGVGLCFKRATLWANTLLVEGTAVKSRRKGTCQLALDTLGILWDGRLTLCCLDFDGVLSFGNAAEGTIRSVLDSERYHSLRRSFEEGNLVLPFCQRCRGPLTGPGARSLLPGSLPALAGEGWKYVRRFRTLRTLRRIPQEISRYFIGNG